MSAPPTEITHEPIADVPLLMHVLHDQLAYDRLLDGLCPRHGNWQGLSLGQTLVTWLTHILSTQNHFMSHVQDWVAQLPELWTGLWGQPVRALDVSDDRLAAVARHLSEPAIWQPLEQQVTQQLVRVYDLAPQCVRLDTTTAKVYSDRETAVLFQRGYSKDHRPDLRQLKVMLASLDPLGVLVGAEVVPGNTADDGLYVPMIARLRQALAVSGLLYVGDCKMSALPIRAYLAQTKNWYLTPLAQVGTVPADLAQAVEDAVRGKLKLHPLRAEAGPTRLGQVAEWTRRLTAETDQGRVKWVERVLLVRSDAYAQAAVRGLRTRLTRAQTELRALTPARGRGQRQFTDEAQLQAAVDALLARYAVAGLLTVKLHRETEQRTVRAYGDTRAHLETRHRYPLTVTEKRAAIRAAEIRLGWRLYVTNAPTRQLSRHQAVWTYRDPWLAEHNGARLKGRGLSLAPRWVQREDHAIGLTHVLTLAARVLAVLEYQVRRTLADEKRALVGLYPGQPTRATAQPTTERLLHAFQVVSLTLLRKGAQVFYLLPPLSALQCTILHDVGAPANLYQRWFPKSWKPLRI